MSDLKIYNYAEKHFDCINSFYYHIDYILFYIFELQCIQMTLPYSNKHEIYHPFIY